MPSDANSRASERKHSQVQAAMADDADQLTTRRADPFFFFSLVRMHAIGTGWPIGALHDVCSPAVLQDREASRVQYSNSQDMHRTDRST